MRLGQWGATMQQKEMESFIENCLQLNLIDFDHADIYGSYTTEDDFGRVLNKRPDLRKQMRITTKCGIKLIAPNRPQHQIKSYDLTKKHIKTSVENSLESLQTDYIDTLLLHRPDYLMDPHDILEAFTELKDEGKVLHFGVSNFSTEQFDMLQHFFPLCTNQIEISLLKRDAFKNGQINELQKYNVQPTAWSPLGGGELLKPSENKQYKRIQEVLLKFGEKYDADNDQILLAWLLKHPSKIVPVLGTSKISRIKKAKESLNIQLSHEEWYMLWEAAEGKEID